MKKLIKQIQALIYPPFCWLCDTPMAALSDILICEDCLQQLPFNQQSVCPSCALPKTTAVCGYCLINPPVWQKARALFTYEMPINQRISQLKYRARLSQAEWMAFLFAQTYVEQIQSEPPEIIIPVPLHPTKIRQRGFNQAYELAQYLQPLIEIPINYQLVKKIKNTTAQAHLTSKQRLKNLRGAFSVVQNHQYRHVAIFDDVITTGTTMTELSQVLLKSGVEKIEVWTIARAIK